jgi:hypothetical protein
MKKSNLFAYIELSKFVDALKNDGPASGLKNKLMLQSSYFNVINAKYFSDTLVNEWIDLQKLVNSKGVKRDDSGSVEMSATMHTIESFSEEECGQIAQRITALFDNVKREFE